MTQFKKPDWRLPEYKHYPSTRIHSAMKDWALKNAQPSLVVEIRFSDDSESTTVYEPASKEVSYKHEGEQYSQNVDVAGKYVYSDLKVSRSKLLELEKAFYKKHNIQVKEIKYSLK